MSYSKSGGLVLSVVIIVLLVFALWPVGHFMFFRAFHGGAPAHFMVEMMQDLARPPILPTTLPFLLMSLLWILLAVWVYSDAERRGMSGILWALLVFVGNVVGLVIYLIVRSGAAMPGPVMTTPSSVCPACKTPVQADFNICPNCGENLKQTCPKCHKSVQADWKLCPYCGEPL